MKKALIVHVGDKYTRLIKSIDKIKPDLVYFTYNEGYEDLINKIIKISSVSFEKRTCLINDFQSIKESYEKSKEIFKELKNEGYEIHVGVSNGTKAMVVGLSLASVGYDCEFSYVGSVKGGREKGEVIEGKEKVFDEFHPMKQLATIEINRAKRYFNNYQFDESLNNFKKARSVLDDKRRMDMYIKIVNLYQFWDKFENMIPYINNKNKESQAQLDYYLKTQIKDEIDNDESLKKYFYENEKEFMEKLSQNIKFLDKKISKKGFIEENDVYYYLPDLLNNAYRRIEENKFDDSTARLYRAAELISQIRLYEKGFIEKSRLRDNKVFHTQKQTLVESNSLKVLEYVARQADFQDPNKKTLKLGLKENYELLKRLDDDLAIRFLEDSQLDNLLSDRNNSILAHGFVPAVEDDTIKLFDKLVEYSRQTLPNLDKCMEYAEFPKFSDVND